VPMHAHWREQAFRDPWFRVPPSGCSNVLDPLKPGLQTLSGFMVPMRSRDVVGVLQEPTRPSNCSLLWESGAEDARTPNASAWSIDSSASAKRLECVRFIGAFPPAGDGQRFMVPMHGKKTGPLSMKRKVGRASRLPRRRSRWQICFPGFA